jgi:hypothetical protein
MSTENIYEFISILAGESTVLVELLSRKLNNILRAFIPKASGYGIRACG